MTMGSGRSATAAPPLGTRGTFGYPAAVPSNLPRSLALLLCVATLAPLSPSAGAIPLTIRARTQLDVRAQRRSDGLHLMGTLRDDQGQPVASELLHVTIQGASPQPVTTNGEGAFDVVVRPSDLRDLERIHGTSLTWSASYTGDKTHGAIQREGRVDLSRESTWLQLRIAPERVSLDADNVAVDCELGSDAGPVAAQPIRIRIGDGPELVGETDGTGRARFLLRPASLGRAGRFEVKARYLGDHIFAPAEALGTMRVLLPTRVTLRVGREGDAATGRYRFSGRLIDARGAIDDATIAILVRQQGEVGETELPRRLTTTDSGGIYLTAIDARSLFEDTSGGLEIRAAYRPTDDVHLASVSRPIPVPVPPPPGVPTRWYLAGLLWVLAILALAHVIRNRLWRAVFDKLKPRRAQVLTTPPEPPGDVVDPPFVIQPGGESAQRRPDWVSGKVVDAHSSSGVQGVAVIVISPSQEVPIGDGRVGSHVTRAITDDKGDFALGPLPEGSWELRMLEPDYLPRALQLNLPHRGDLDGATFALVATRRRIRDIYVNALARHASQMRWGWDTPLEGLAMASPRDDGTRLALSSLRSMVESAWFTRRRPKPEDAQQAARTMKRMLRDGGQA